MRYHTGFRSLLLWGVSLALVLAVAWPASAGLVQLTSSGTDDSRNQSISGNGSKVAFVSNANPFPPNNDDGSWEIFVIDADGTGLLQLTSDATYDCSNPSLSGDGSVVVFASRADPLTTNGDHSEEIFLIHSDGTGLQQLTNSGGWSGRPVISANGSKVVFQSGANLTGENPDDTLEIFVMDSAGTGLLQLTSCSGTDECSNASISADGSKVVFESNANLVGSGNMDGSSEIYLINSNKTGLTQLTSATAAYTCMLPEISDDGSKVVFCSDADLLIGENSDNSLEIFLIDSDKTDLTQLTSYGALTLGSGDADINADGSKLVFCSDADLLTGENSDGSVEIFLINSDKTGLTQLTSSDVAASFCYQPAISADGSKVVFSSEADWTGGNPDGSEEVFLASLGSVGPGANATPWIAMKYDEALTPTSVPIPVDDGNGWVTEASFSDVPSTGLGDDEDEWFWAWGEIEECAATHTEAEDFIVQGYGGGIYLPENKVTRAQMAVFVWRGLVRGDGDVVLGGPAVSDDLELDPGAGNAGFLLPSAVTTTGCNTVDGEDEDLPVEGGAVVFVVLDAAQVDDGFVDFDLEVWDYGDPEDDEDDVLDPVDSEQVTVDEGDCKAAVDTAGGVPYLIVAYHVDPADVAAAGDYVLTLTLPNGNVTEWEFTVE